MNILYYLPINKMNNVAVERFIDSHYSKDSILIYAVQEECDFNSRIKGGNLYSADDMLKRNFNMVKGFYGYPPIDDALIKSMGKYEGEIYKMMDGYFPPVNGFNERQKIYYDALRLFNGMIVRNQISCFIEMGIPHEIFSFIIYCLCKVKGIKTIMTYRLPVPGYTYYFYDLREHFAIELSDFHGSEDKLSSDFLEEYRKHIKANGDVTPYYFRGKSKKKRGMYLGKRIRQFFSYDKLLKNAVTIAKLSERKRQIDKKIAEVAVEPDYGRKYLYCALHFQPEGTTSPCAGIYVNQQLIIGMLSYAVPDDIYIYVKAHPDQGFRGTMDVDFYDRLSKLRNVCIMPTGASSSVLEDNSIASVTCIGTIAYESMYKKKPSLLFGDFVYNYIPGAYTVRDLNDCIRAISEILKGVEITDRQILDFVCKMDKISYKADITNELLQVLKDKGLTYADINGENYRLLEDAYNGISNSKQQ